MWQEKENQLCKTFKFQDFKTAFAFMTEVALTAEKINHHPRWTNLYNQVSFELFTFDANNTVTERDHKLAAAIDQLAVKYLPPA